MTLIAFAARPDRADIITDTLAYTRIARYVSRTSKVLLLPHLDAALLTQGSTQFGHQWYVEALTDTTSTSLDLFNDAAPAALTAVWERMQDAVRQQHEEYGATQTLARSVVFHVGWSERTGRFTAHGFASDDGFTPFEITGLHVMPSPLNVRPSDLELARLEDHLRGAFGEAPAVDHLRRQPVPDVPDTAEEWADLARSVRLHRALADLYSGLKTYVGGDVIHTRLTRAEATQRVIHTFNDVGPEFAQMMAGSLHPLGQVAACDCGSGQRLIDCCLAGLAGQACPCGSGGLFADCCSVRAARAVEAVK